MVNMFLVTELDIRKKGKRAYSVMTCESPSCQVLHEKMAIDSTCIEKLGGTD